MAEESSKPKSRFAAFNPEEREVMLLVMQAHINTIGEVCATIEQREIYVGRYFVIFEDLIREISEA